MTAARSQIRDVGIGLATLWVARQVTSLPWPVLAALAPLLARAERETATALRRYLATVPSSGAQFTVHEHARLLLEMRTPLDTIRRISPALATSLDQSYDRAGVLSRQHLEGIVRRVGGHQAGRREPLRIDLTQSAALPALGRYGAKASKYSQDVESRIRRELAVGILKNESTETMINRLAAKGNIKAKGAAAKAADGLVSPAQWMLRRLVATETAVAYETQAHQAFLEAQIQAPSLRRIWDARMDAKICARCAGLNGKVSGSDGTIGGLVPPIHPYCRCVLLPYHPSWGGMAAEIREAA